MASIPSVEDFDFPWPEVTFFKSRYFFLDNSPIRYSAFALIVSLSFALLLQSKCGLGFYADLQRVSS